MTMKDTNVHVLFLQQELFFLTWWAAVASNKPLGLVQRFLFSFGARLNLGKQAWNRLLDAVTIPIIENLFASLVRRYGPHTTTTADPFFQTTAAQRRVIVELEEIGRLFARKDSVHVTLREAMPKALYWLGTSVLTNHLLSHLWSVALGFESEEQVPDHVSDQCFLASVQFMIKRYLYGQAVLSVTVREQGWLQRVASPTEKNDAVPLLLRILRGAPGSTITLDHIFCADLALKRSLEKGAPEAAQLARQKVALIWQQLADLGLGELEPLPGDSGYQLRKYHIASLQPGCLAWLRKHRVPVSHFGQRSRVDHAAFLGPCPPETVRSAQDDASPVNASGDGSGGHKAPHVAFLNPKTPTPGSLAPKAKASRKTTATVWRDLPRVDLGLPLLSDKALMDLLQKRPEWEDSRVGIRKLWANQERRLLEICCLESASCSCRWRAHYILPKTLYQPGTLLLQVGGAHTGHGEDRTLTGKLFTPKQHDIAAAFVQSGNSTAKALRTALVAGGCPDATLPTNKQLGNWLRNARRKIKASLDKDIAVVEAVQLQIDSLPRSPPDSVDQIFLLAQPVVTDAEVCVIFSCPGMLDTLRHYSSASVALAVDTKMKVLDRGMGVATLSLLVKDELRATHLTRACKGSRTMGRAWVAHGLPLLQAIFHAETKPNYVALFKTTCDVWRAHTQHQPLLQNITGLQIHKDFHASIEEARNEVFPLSRACDDFFHFSEKTHTTMQAKCQHVSLQRGKYIKTHLQFAKDIIAILRFVPTLTLFSWLWQAFLATLRNLGEGILADWLKTYERPLPAQFASENVGPDIVYVSFWVGFEGIIPGMGSGSQPAEAIHAAWQRELMQLGGKGSINHCLHVLQNLYTQHWKSWYNWGAMKPLTCIPSVQDPQLVNGAAVRRAGRTPAIDFFRLPRETVYTVCRSAGVSWVAVASNAKTSPLNRGAAARVLQLLQQPNTLSRRSLPDLFDSSGNLSLQSLRFHFQDIVYAKMTPTEQLCSCPASAMHLQCEHTTFLRSLELENFPVPPLILADLPKQHQPGRKRRGSDVLPPRKRRKASWEQTAALCHSSGQQMCVSLLFVAPLALLAHNVICNLNIFKLHGLAVCFIHFCWQVATSLPNMLLFLQSRVSSSAPLS